MKNQTREDIQIRVGKMVSESYGKDARSEVYNATILNTLILSDLLLDIRQEQQEINNELCNIRIELENINKTLNGI